jgi:leucyl-tRNA synthetase
MVQGKTFKERSTGRYVKSEEVELSEDSHHHYVVKTTRWPVMMTWEKMSKSKYNGVDPNDMIQRFGSDATRSFILFKAPIDQALEWDNDAIVGHTRWLRRVYHLVSHAVSSSTMEKITSPDPVRISHIRSATQEAIKQVSEKKKNALLLSL